MRSSHEPVADQAAVGLDLRFTRPTEEAEAAALPLQVGPGPHQARALIFQMRQFDLQRAFLRRRPLAENVQDQAGRSMTLQFQARSRLRCCTGDRERRP